MVGKKGILKFLSPILLLSIVIILLLPQPCGSTHTSGYGMADGVPHHTLPTPANYVHRPLVEFFTGLSCSSCMNGPHPDMEEIWSEHFDEPSQPFTYVEFHELNGGGVDDLATEDSRDRMRHYQPGVSGTPDAEFDGGYIELGGITGGSLNKASALEAIDDAKVRYQRNINPLHPLQSKLNDFKYVNLFVDQMFTGDGFAVSVDIDYLGSNAILPLGELKGSLYVFMVEEGAEAYSTIEEKMVVCRNVFRDYAIQGLEFTLSKGETFQTTAEWKIPEATIPIRPGNISAVAAVFDLDDTASEEGNKGNPAQVPRCIQSATPLSTAFDRENQIPTINNVKASFDGTIEITAELDDEHGISSAHVLYNFDAHNSTDWKSIEMNLSGEEICDDSGVCYAYKKGTGTALVSDESGNNTIFYRILAYDGSAVELGGLGAEARTEVHVYTYEEGKAVTGETGSVMDGIWWIMVAAGVLFIGGAMIVLKRGRKGGSTGPPRIQKKKLVILGVVFAVVLLIIGIYAASLGGSEDAPDFSLTGLDGEEITLNGLEGKVVLLDFMATWCPGCQDVMDTLKSAHEKYGNDIEIITIDVDGSETPAELEAFRNEYGATWKFAMDTDDLLQKYNVIAIPKLVIIDGSGEVTFTHEGDLSMEELEDEIDNAIAGTSSGISLGGTSLGLAGFAVVVGVGSFFSPCSFPLLPGYMSYYLGMEKKKSVRRALMGGAAAGAGLVMVYLLLGIIIGLGGSAVKSYISILEPIIGVIILGLGIVMVFRLNIPFEKITGTFGKIADIFKKGKRTPIKEGERGNTGRNKSWLSRKMGGSDHVKLFFYGLGYAGAAAGCTAPLLIATIMGGLASGGFFNALVLFLIVAGVMAALMIFVTILIALSAQAFLDKLRMSTQWIQRGSGIILVVVGIYLIGYYFT